MDRNEKTHAPRAEMKEIAPKVFALMQELSRPVEGISLDAGLRELLKIRASQINGCAFCLDMHIRVARTHGVTDDRMHMLNAWRDAPCFSEAERAALELTEAVTRIADAGVPDALYERVRRHFSAEQYVALLTTISVINAWNRFMVSLGVVPPTH